MISQLHGSTHYPPLSRASVEIRTDLTVEPRRPCALPLGLPRLRNAVLALTISHPGET